MQPQPHVDGVPELATYKAHEPRKMTERNRPKIYRHRSSTNQEDENSCRGLQLLADAEYAGAEADVTAMACGTLVMKHDLHIDARSRRIDLKNWTYHDLAHYLSIEGLKKVDTLSEFLETASLLNIEVNLDFKVGYGDEVRSSACIERFLSKNEPGCEKISFLTSFNETFCEALKSEEISIPFGPIIENRAYLQASPDRKDEYSVFSVDASTIEPTLILGLKTPQNLIATYGLKRGSRLAERLQNHVDVFITSD